MSTFIVRDVRLAGWRPAGDVLEVDEHTPLQWIVDNIIDRGKKASGDLDVIIMAHGLPGFVNCGSGDFRHPTAGAGISIADLNTLGQAKGCLKRLQFYSCLVARMGSCYECNGHAGFDGNEFCYRLAKEIQAEVKASIHLQYYFDGTVTKWFFRRPDGKGIDFGGWNGRVFTWGPQGNILKTEDFPYKD